MARKKNIGLLIIVTAVLAVLRSIIVVYGMEKNTYETDTYYLPDNIFVDIFTWISVIAVIFFIGMAVKIGKGSRFEFDFKSTPVSGASCMLAFILFGAAFIYAYTFFATDAVPTNIGIAIAVLSVLSGVGFLLYALRSLGKNTLAFFGLFPILLWAMRLLGDFIRTSATPLASSGAYHIAGLVAAMLYFYCEGKAFINGGSAAVYLAAGYVSVILLTVYAVPNLILHCFGVFVFDYYAAFSAVDLVAAGYISTRMSSANIITPKRDLAMMLGTVDKAS